MRGQWSDDYCKQQMDTPPAPALRVQNGKMVSSSKGTRKVLLTVEHLPRARNAHNQRDVRRRNREGNKRVGGGECRCIRRENTVVQKDYRDSSHGKK